jgi:hypothetical protein
MKRRIAMVVRGPMIAALVKVEVGLETVRIWGSPALGDCIGGRVPMGPYNEHFYRLGRRWWDHWLTIVGF